MGISPHVEQLGDIVLSNSRNRLDVKKGDPVAVFESVKAASDIYSPVTGKITEVNEKISSDFKAITPEKAMENWLFRIKVSDASELDNLMDENTYNSVIN